MSSDSRVTVVEIQKVMTHPNADALDIAFPFDGYPVVVRRGEYAVGDRAVYVPVDMQVPVADERFTFLAPRGHVDGLHRIKAIRLRGVYSEGLLVPALDSESVGDDVTEAIGAVKWEPPLRFQMGGGNVKTPGAPPEWEQVEGGPSRYPTYTDVENLRKHGRAMAEAEGPFVATEKIHGANGRFVWTDGRLYCGSRTQWKAQHERNLWWACAAAEGLAEKLQKIPDVLIFGEVYGQVQDLQYGAKVGFVAFDAWGQRPDGTLGYFDYADFVRVTEIAGIPRVPVIYGCEDLTEEAIATLNERAEGPTVLGAGVHVREGVVVRPLREQWHPTLGRVIAKLIGQGYRLRKGA